MLEEAIYEAEDLFTKTDIKAISQALVEANGRARVRTLDLDDCCTYIGEYMKTLDGLSIPKAAMTGTRLTVHAAIEKMPRAYRGIPESTQADFEYKNGKWHFLSAYRGIICQRVGIRHVIATLSDKAKAAIADHFSIW